MLQTEGPKPAQAMVDLQKAEIEDLKLERASGTWTGRGISVDRFPS